MKVILFKDLARKKPLGGKPVEITFNEDFTKCRINCHRMKKVRDAFTKSNNVVKITTYVTKLWGEEVYFKVTTKR